MALLENYTIFYLPLGMITLPMTFLSNTPLECTIHPEFWYNNLTTDLFTHDDVVSKTEVDFHKKSIKNQGIPTGSSGKDGHQI